MSPEIACIKKRSAASCGFSVLQYSIARERLSPHSALSTENKRVAIFCQIVGASTSTHSRRIFARKKRETTAILPRWKLALPIRTTLTVCTEEPTAHKVSTAQSILSARAITNRWERGFAFFWTQLQLQRNIPSVGVSARQLRPKVNASCNRLEEATRASCHLHVAVFSKTTQFSPSHVKSGSLASVFRPEPKLLEGFTD
jgi:hypothetical protein